MCSSDLAGVEREEARVALATEVAMESDGVDMREESRSDAKRRRRDENRAEPSASSLRIEFSSSSGEKRQRPREVYHLTHRQ